MGSVGGFWAGVAVLVIGGKTLQDTDSIVGSAAGLVIGGVGSCLIFLLFGLLVRTLARSKKDTIDLSIRIGMAVAGALGVAVGTTSGDAGLGAGSTGFLSSIPAGVIQGITVGSAFLALYLPSYYRLPLYPINAFSMIRAYHSSRRSPKHVFTYLRQSALHFDECVFLPLPFLTRILRIAATQNLPAVLKEIEYIVSERPQQSRAAQTIAYEIALNDLSRRQFLTDIGQAYLELPNLLSSRVRKLNPSIAKLFSSLEESSRDAASYSRHNNIESSKRESYDALQRMLVHLNTINPQTAFREAALNRKLADITERWQLVAKQAQETLNISVSSYSLITNPYTAGPTLLPIDGMPNPVFVGRDDIAKRLNRALQRTPHPTFCLTGERRMGKSSILKQLPVLLGSSYLPIFCDLHNPAAHSGIAAFFASVSEAIEEHLVAKGLLISSLSQSRLQDMQRENEVAVYTAFDNWLKSVEHLLQVHNRILLLMFDEFENLEAFRQRGLLDLDLLLSWFRSTSQNSTHVAFLFCGVKTLHEMGPNWTGHFVNVERIKVSFLQSGDARDLIHRPVSAYSTHSIFDEETTEEIIRVTRCHPFLLQALCSRLIDNLNDASREQANMQDIATAMEEIFDAWKEYFWDQWQRSSQEQQRCLITLYTLGKGNGAQIAQHSNISAYAVYHALDQLQERDIVSKEQHIYQFAVPIFARWVGEHYNLFQ